MAHSTSHPSEEPPSSVPLPAAPPGAQPAEPSHGAGATPFPVIGIGASAGGMAALTAFLEALTAEHAARMAVVLVQHLGKGETHLVQLLQPHTALSVQQAAHETQVQPGHLYVAPPGSDLALMDGILLLQPQEGSRKPRLSVDHFFSSLASSQREQAIAIVLSGAGSDGTLGVRDVKGEGGLVLAQAPESAEQDGMPRSAIASGMVDFILPPAQMPAQIDIYLHHRLEVTQQQSARSQRENLLKKLCILLRAQTGHDFSQYKETTLLRRMERRMALHQITRPAEYLRLARESAHEVDALFRDLLIGVTNFFRDAQAFAVVEEKIIPRLVAAKGGHDALRVWVCGCSTGEEAYSIAIALYEHMLAAKRTLKVQIFATDIDKHAIEHARAGLYPSSIAANVSEERLARYFVHDTQRGTYRIQKHIRDLVVFSEQDVIKDPPFSRLDIISCRNLLIYLNGDLQRKLIPLFHYALVPHGTLFLGTSETVGESARLFHAIDRKWKIYQRLPSDRTTLRPSLPEFLPSHTEGGGPLRHAAAGEDEAGEANNLRQLTGNALLAHYAPTGVLVNARGQILHVYGRTGRFLEPADGDASMNVLAMAREGLRRELTIALHKAVAHKELVAYPGLQIQSNGGFIRTDLAVRPVEMSNGTVVYLVVFAQVQEHAEGVGAADAEAGQGGRIAELERELRAKDEYLQTTLEEMETTNEELKSTNEEMQSVNEELQSTNEELETSKEELQSVNEELCTVNAELQDKVADLSRANNDMNNLLAGTGVGTVFVDHELRIARFTPAAAQVINFINSDIGRPLEHVSSNLVGYDSMVEDIRRVLDTLVPKEAEVQVKNGGWYLMRIRPYRTMENMIEGAVITLVDISERKLTEQSLRQSEARLQALIHHVHAGVSETDLQGRLLFVNDRLCEMLGHQREELLRKRHGELCEAAGQAALAAAARALGAGGPEVQLPLRYLRKDASALPVLVRGSAIRGADGRPSSLLFLAVEEPLGSATP